MAYRSKMGRKTSARQFRKGAGVHKKNLWTGAMRGGYRL